MLAADLTYREGEVLEQWPDPSDPAFLEWCRQQAGSEPHSSDPGRERQVRAMTHLVYSDPAAVEQHWPLLLAIVDGGRPPLAVASATGIDWLDRGLVDAARQAELVALLTDIASNGRMRWDGKDARATAVAADALLRLDVPWPLTPAKGAGLVRDAIRSLFGREAGLALAEHLLAAANSATRKAVRATLQKLLERDKRLDSNGDEAIEDDATVHRMAALLGSARQ